MSCDRIQDWKYNLDAHAYFDTFYNCRSSHYRYKEYMKDVVQTYHDVFNDRTFQPDPYKSIQLLVIIVEK